MMAEGCAPVPGALRNTLTLVRITSQRAAPGQARFGGEPIFKDVCNKTGLRLNRRKRSRKRNA